MDAKPLEEALTRTAEQIADRDSVWAQVRQQCPEFIQAYDPTDNYHAVREIVLGGSTSWRGAHDRFKPGPGKLVLDLGANVGIYTAFAASQGARVVAYEPGPTTFSILSKMVKDAGFREVSVVNSAAWTESGTLRFRDFGSETCGRIERNGEAFGPGQTQNLSAYESVVSCVSFDDIIGRTDWDFVKMDIESAEYFVFLEASVETLSHIKRAYVELHPWVDFGIYARAMDRLDDSFRIDGGRASDGRWAYLYLEQR